MTPLNTFNDVWIRCSALKSLHAFLAGRVSPVLNIDELLRAEWATYISALDLYVHELTVLRMLEIHAGLRPAPASFLKFNLPLEITSRLIRANSEAEASNILELELRSRFSTMSFQDPEKIADAARLFSEVPLWNSVALHKGATPSSANDDAKRLKQRLSIIVHRRNKIVHEGDMQPGFPRTPWPIDRAQVDEVAEFIHSLVHSFDAVLN